MATRRIRTQADELADAVAAIDDAQRELANWRAHVERMAGSPDHEAIGFQARRSERIVKARIADAEACIRAAQFCRPALRSVS